MAGLTLEPLIIGPIGRFEEIRVVVSFIQGIGAPDRFFRGYVVRLVELMIGGISTEGDMLGRTVVLFYLTSLVLQVQIWQTQRLSHSLLSVSGCLVA